MNLKLHALPKLVKRTLVVFLLTLAFGYFSGLDLLKHTTDFNAEGIEKNILGSEEDEYAEELYFKMSEGELHTIIHSHVITLGVVFVFLSFMIFISSYPSALKSFLMIEPMIALVTTFGGLWLLWNGISWVKYLIMISGILMHLSFLLIILLLLKDLIIKKL